MEQEIWKPVPGYEGRYEVSSWGRLASVARVRVTKAGRVQFVRRKPLKLKAGACGYLRIGLYNDEGRQVFHQVHRIVCVVFVGPAPLEKPFVNHKDLNKANNTPSNLEWCTNQENMDHAVANLALSPIPGKVRFSRQTLRPADVASIREMLAARTLPARVIAERFNVATSTISNIATAKTWRLPSEAPITGRDRVNCPFLHPSRRRKLSVEDVAAIRAAWAASPRPLQRELGARFGVAQTTIGAIVRGDSWNPR